MRGNQCITEGICIEMCGHLSSYNVWMKELNANGLWRLFFFAPLAMALAPICSLIIFRVSKHSLFIRDVTYGLVSLQFDAAIVLMFIHVMRFEW